MENKLFNYKVIQKTTLEGAEDMLNMYGMKSYEDDTIIVYGEYDPASHIYNYDNEVNLNIPNERV